MPVWLHQRRVTLVSCIVVYLAKCVGWTREGEEENRGRAERRELLEWFTLTDEERVDPSLPRKSFGVRLGLLSGRGLFLMHQWMHRAFVTLVACGTAATRLANSSTISWTFTRRFAWM